MYNWLATIRDLTLEHQQHVAAKGYIDVDELRPEHVTRSHDNWDFRIKDWHNIYALINVAHLKQRYRTIIITLDCTIIKCRKTVKHLMRDIKDDFPINYHNDTKLLARALGIEVHAPFVCGDFWLFPMTKLQCGNYTWFRWQSPHYLLYDRPNAPKGIDVLQKGLPPLRFSTTSKAIRSRIDKATLLAEFYLTHALRFMPSDTLHMLTELSFPKFQKALLRYQKLQHRRTAGKYISPRHDPMISDQAHEELEKGKNCQLPEFEDLTYDWREEDD